MKKLLYLYIGIILLSSCAKIDQQDTNQELENKINSILSKLSLSEKIGQMMQVPGNFASDSNQLIYLVKEGLIGSVINEVDPRIINKLQKIAVNESKHGIPLIIGRDVIHGFKTIFPIPLAQAASWNPGLIEKSAHNAASEARSAGVNWTFSPMIDVSRDPRWGRVAEGYGEDPYLTGIMGNATIRGYQGNRLSDKDRMAACAKHFAAYGAVEAGRDYNTVILSDQELRNVYLPPYKSAVDAGVATFMTSFNEINGVPSSGNKQLLTDLLRNEWGFHGFVVSDWTSIPEMINHGFATDESQSALLAANAGVDMEMSSTTYIDNLENLVKQNKMEIETIDQAVRNILKVKLQLGLFENPYVDIKKTVVPNDSSLAMAQTLAEESLVLLKNENQTLPLSTNIRKVAVIGPMANDRYEQLGTWVFDADTTMTITPLSAIRSMLGNDKVTYLKTLSHSRDERTLDFEKARILASKADAVLVFVGEESILSGEAHGRANINLPGVQAELVKELHKTGKPIIAILMAGRPLSITNILPFASAVIYAWHPGTMGGPAIANAIFGKINPSGKLPISMPVSAGQCPIYYSKKNTGRPADYINWVPINKIPVRAPQTSLGNTSHHLDDGFEPLFPFGFGLSYTTFEYSNLRLSSETIPVNGSLIINVTIENKGKMDGFETVQLYVRDLTGSITRPVKELKGFKKINLKAGEKKELEFTLKADELAFYKSWNEKVVEPGAFNVWIGADSNSGLMGRFQME